jgi:membrane-bound serine protease (ClpP class)
MTLGLLGIWVEVKAPGFGVPGVLGTLALVAFFFGHMVVHLAGWEEVLLLTAGLILIAIEVLLIPGFGLPGVMGVVSLAFAFVMAMTGLPIGVAWEVGALELASVRVFVSLLVVVVGAILVARYIPESAYPQWLVLRTAIEDEAGARQHAAVGGDAAGLVGRRGLAVTDLRPSGTARVEGKLFDVVGRGPWIEAGEPIVVLEVDGVRVLVDRPEAEPEPPMNQS